MQQSIARSNLLAAVTEALSEAPVVALLGARQVGKTTLAGQVASAWPGPSTVFDLEVATTRAALAETPERLLRRSEGLVVIDEVQRMPGLFEVLRPICDDRNRNAVFLLLGSASWDLIRGVSETLAGRILFVDVGGFSLAEAGPGSQDRLWMRGGFPRAYLARSAAAWTRWMQSFTRTFLERDVPGLGSKVSPEALGRFWRMLAHYHGQTWNASELARSMDVSVTAVNHYRDLLAGTFMIRVLPPWFENLGKRLVKSPKVCLRDSGIPALPAGPGRDGGPAGAPALRRELGGVRPGADADRAGGAGGVLLRHATRRRAGPDAAAAGEGAGASSSNAPTPRATTKSMHVVIEDLGLSHLWVLYPGDREYPLTDTVTALPLKNIHGLDLRPAP